MAQSKVSILRVRNAGQIYLKLALQRDILAMYF